PARVYHVSRSGRHPDLHSFPTRRSSDLPDFSTGSKFQDASKYYHADGNYNFSHLWDVIDIQAGGSYRKYELNSYGTIYTDYNETDRKSTRLNSSHVKISYAVFCLKKKMT